MVTAEELIVEIQSVGVGEAREDLEGMEEAMENTAESAGNSAEQLSEFTDRFKGALSAAVAGLAVGIGGLLSTIPVVGEVLSGLFAIFEAFGFQIDQLARQMGAGGLTTTLFDLAAAIYELDGTAGDLAGVFAVIATAVASAAAAVAAWAVKTMGVAGAASALVGALKTVATVIAGIVGGISATAAALAVAIVAIVAFAAAYITNFKGVRDTTNRIIGQIINFIVNGFNSLSSKAMSALANLKSDAQSVLSSLASDISSWAGGLASDAFEWGKNVVNEFVSGIKSVISTLRKWLTDLGEIGASIGIDVPDLGGIMGGSGGGGGGGGGGRPRFNGTSTGGTQIDGRQLSESTGRYRSDPGRRRGL